MNVQHEELRQRVAEIFVAAGCEEEEAQGVADSLVEANLTGHDSHGVIRVKAYVGWLGEGKLFADRKGEVVVDAGPLGLIDGQLGFGQTMGRKVVQMALEKMREHGVGVVGLRNSGHVGRVGEWVERAAESGAVSVAFVNTSGRGILTAPFGGIDRRLSATPIAAGIPREDGPIVLDISCSAIAEGKVRVALNRGTQLDEGYLIDHEGNPITDPATFYADPPGAILPFGGHKGYGLGVVTEILAGSLTGNGASAPGKTTLEQGMLLIALDPARFQTTDAFAEDIERFVAWVKSSRTRTAAGDILLPGEIERRTRETRLREGIELDPTTWEQLRSAAETVGVELTEKN